MRPCVATVHKFDTLESTKAKPHDGTAVHVHVSADRVSATIVKRQTSCSYILFHVRPECPTFKRTQHAVITTEMEMLAVSYLTNLYELD